MGQGDESGTIPMTNFRACLAEFLGTFFLCFAGIAAILSATPAVGSVPGAWRSRARSFGPALEMTSWAFHWMYWAVPIAGAVVAALMYDNLLMVKSKDSGLESAKGPGG